jgi:hypothetical protein
MKKVSLILLVVFAAMTVAMAQINSNYSSPTDVLGAHLVYGRGCVACHAPHSGARGNGIQTLDTTSGNVALWGADLKPYYSQTFAFGDAGTYSYTAPANSSAGAHDSQVGIMLCLSCHDGNLARNGMMTGQTVETIPNRIGGHAPTLLGNDGTTAGNYNNDHPVGPLAIVGCGGAYNWDCTANGDGTISMNGVHSSQFVNYDYGNVVKLSAYNGKATVTCMSCHDQHSMTVWAGTIGGRGGFYQTMFFLRGYYNPGDPSSNSAAQFCRNCHGGEANEMHNSNLPTT